MRVVTSEMMREIDRITIDERGIPGMILMNSAGMGVAQLALDYISDDEDLRIIILVGPGNNGGDGWVAARYLAQANCDVFVASAVDPKNLKGDARTAYEQADEAGIEHGISPEGNIDLDGFDLAIDALLGTGAKGAPRGGIGEMVSRTIESGIDVIAVDNPTGVDADTGEVPGDAILAIATATFGLPKLGQFQYPGKSYVGYLNVVDISIPPDVYKDMSPDWRVDSTEDLSNMLPPRYPNGHKGTFGKAAIIAGSPGMTGAVVMSAESCLRTGTGLVEIVVPEGIIDTVDILFREAVSRPVQQVKSKRCLSVRALGDILKIIEDCEAIAIGPGIGTHRETVDLVGRIVSKNTKPAVIDADGLNCIAKLRRRNIDIEFGGKTILTPHPGELSRLLDIPIEQVAEQRYKKINEWASQLGADILVLKGAPTTIAGPETPIYINRTGNSGMASGGSGDVLTGAITAFLAQGLSPLDSARLGVYIHSFAGDIATAALGARGMIAGDIIDCIPEALLDLELYIDL